MALLLSSIRHSLQSSKFITQKLTLVWDFSLFSPPAARCVNWKIWTFEHLIGIVPGDDVRIFVQGRTVAANKHNILSDTSRIVKNRYNKYYRWIYFYEPISLLICFFTMGSIPKFWSVWRNWKIVQSTSLRRSQILMFFRCQGSRLHINT